jgi:hypothetical protein
MNTFKNKSNIFTKLHSTPLRPAGLRSVPFRVEDNSKSNKWAAAQTHLGLPPQTPILGLPPQTPQPSIISTCPFLISFLL